MLQAWPLARVARFANALAALNCQTLGGFVMMVLGRIPSAGDCFEWDKLRFEVVDMDGLRVDKVLVVPRVDA